MSEYFVEYFILLSFEKYFAEIFWDWVSCFLKRHSELSLHEQSPHNRLQPRSREFLLCIAERGDGQKFYYIGSHLQHGWNWCQHSAWSRKNYCIKGSEASGTNCEWRKGKKYHSCLFRVCNRLLRATDVHISSVSDRLLVNGPIGAVGFAQPSGWMDSNAGWSISSNLLNHHVISLSCCY